MPAPKVQNSLSACKSCVKHVNCSNLQESLGKSESWHPNNSACEIMGTASRLNYFRCSKEDFKRFTLIPPPPPPPENANYVLSLILLWFFFFYIQIITYNTLYICIAFTSLQLICCQIFILIKTGSSSNSCSLAVLPARLMHSALSGWFTWWVVFQSISSKPEAEP